MKYDKWTRRQFLTSMGASAACLALPGIAAEMQPFTFVQICDTQLGFGGYERDVKAFRQAVQQVNVLRPDFVVICGDLVNTPSQQSFDDFSEIRAQLNVPCYCAAGNHDIGNQPALKSLQDYRQTVGQDYYSFTHKGHLFVVVNTQLWKSPLKDESEKQDAWLEAVLTNAAHRDARVFVIGHHPLFVKTPDEDEGYYSLPVAKRQTLLALFEKTGVVAVLGGHTHKLIINAHKGIQLVNAETTSNNFDKRPFGFRLWQIGDNRPFQHEFIPLKDR